MYLVIAEKPSVSRAIARVIGAENREEGFLSGKDCIVSWCLGHLAEYLPPDGYDKRYESWKYEDLPIIPDEWKLAVSQEKKEQFYTLKRLLNSPDVESYHSWDRSGHWVIFSSRRIDGRYTRLFLAHYNPEQGFSKPFLLPQKDPEHNTNRLYSYNIPEFISLPLRLSKEKTAKLFQ